MEACRETCPIFQLREVQLRYAELVGAIMTKRYLKLLDTAEIVEAAELESDDEMKANELIDDARSHGGWVSGIAESIEVEVSESRNELNQVAEMCPGPRFEQGQLELIVACRSHSLPQLSELMRNIREVEDFVQESVS